MRTSTKILTITLAMIVICLAWYDLSLKAEYRKGDYTNPYRDFEQLNYRDFDEIELDASTAVGAIIVQGPYKILVNPRAHDFMHIDKQGRHLVISAAFRDHYQSFTSDYMVYISCPKLSLLKTDSWYTAGGTRVTDTVAHDLRWKPTLLKGFSLDSLNLQADHASNLVLEDNKINNLAGIIGQGRNSSPALTIAGNNQFTKGDLSIQNKGQLIVKGAGPGNLNYHLADSATLMVNGASVKHLLNLK
ncbi:MAG TPA: hypothetical protein VG367_07545 [Mucilaginibacter sp.]|nr:hypothetical protein [Mucilaginibacter sp.]